MGSKGKWTKNTLTADILLLILKVFVIEVFVNYRFAFLATAIFFHGVDTLTEWANIDLGQWVDNGLLFLNQV